MRSPWLWLLFLAPAAAPAPAAGSDPFSAGVRWSAGPPPSAPWMPRDVVLTERGELAFAGMSLAHPRVALYATAALDGAEAPLFEGPELAGAIGVVPVAAGAGAHELFAAAQFPAPDEQHRRTEVTRYDAVAAAAGAAFAPVWTRVLPVQPNGPALLAADAAGGLVAAIRDPGAGSVHLEWIDAASGAPLIAVALPGGSLGALALSAGGKRAALTAGLELWVVDDDGAVAHHETLAAATSCLALAADGASLVVGGFGHARVLAEQPGGGFAESAVLPSGPQHVAARAAIAADGTSAAVGFWNFSSGVEVRVLWVETASAAVLADLLWSGAPGLQNFPQELVLSPDATRLAVALWGQGGPEPELVLCERGLPAPLHAWSLGGSALALALDDGTRMAVCRKSAHANQFATTGDVVLVDTGERALQLTGPASLGGSLEQAFLHPGQPAALFALGTPLDGPLAVPGVGGALLLDPGLPLLLFQSAADASGRADLALPVPDSPALCGVTLSAQALALDPAGLAFSALRVDPVLL